MEMMDTNWRLADHQGGGASGPKVALMTPQVFGVGGNGRLAPEGQLGGQKSILAPPIIGVGMMISSLLSK